MSEAKVEFTITGENATEIADKLKAQIPEGATLVTNDAAVPEGPSMLEVGIRESAGLPAKLEAWFASVQAGEGPGFLLVLVICAVIFAVAYGVERLLASWLLKRSTPPSGEDHDALASRRIAAALRWGVGQTARLLVFYALGRVAFAIVFAAGSEAEELAAVALGSLMLARVWYSILELLSGSTDPERRPTALTDPEAKFVMRWVIALVVFLSASAFARDFVVAVVDAGEVGAFFAVVTRILDGIATSIFFFIVRKPVGKLIIRAFSSGDEPGVIMTLLGRYWYLLYILLMGLQVAAESRGYLAGTLGQDASALKRSFAVFVLAPFILAGLGVWRQRRLSLSPAKRQGRIHGIFSLLEGAVIIGSAVMILFAWGIDPFATDLTGAKRIVPGLVSAAITIVVGISVWRTLSAFLDPGKSSEEEEGGESSDGEGGAGGSRFETVFPILRAFLAALVGTITVMLALTSLGVQIGPLLAGAGVLGLAIGFGAQKVVEDVISGLLYLTEDAFRIGEYIETREGKGSVEKIMLRSVRLRHHRGPVFTVPFSAMGTIQNHSRDWVKVKFSFDVAPSEDLERVRKLVKKIGQKLMDDPELDGMFLEPLKSQGAVAMVGPNYQIGVKFSCKPGQQFTIRRKAITAIQQAIKEHGIQVATPRVVVDSPTDAAAAAAKVARDQASAAAAGPQGQPSS